MLTSSLTDPIGPLCISFCLPCEHAGGWGKQGSNHLFWMVRRKTRTKPIICRQSPSSHFLIGLGPNNATSMIAHVRPIDQAPPLPTDGTDSSLEGSAKGGAFLSSLYLQENWLYAHHSHQLGLCVAKGSGTLRKLPSPFGYLAPRWVGDQLHLILTTRVTKPLLGGLDVNVTIQICFLAGDMALF